MVVSKAGWVLRPGRLPAFIFRYPHSVLVVIRLFSMICSICTLMIWHSAQRQFSHDSGFNLIAIFDLLSLLCILLSLWFTIQKFYYVKLDAAFSLTSVIFILGGVAVTGSVSEDVNTNDLFYIIGSSFWSIFTKIVTS
uniref:MARVEL domain-containing protein n=1 Tax=Bursaphelenchus xylophilus TaxID=6326 RepID=A0A1I7RNZ2_BURXY